MLDLVPVYESVAKIERDHSRFRQIVRGKIKKELRKYMTQSELIGKKGKDLVSIPLPEIDLPHFRFGRNQGGVAAGDGQPGDALAGQPQEGGGEAGDQPGEHILEVDLTLDELAKILGEELELPNIQPKGKRTIFAEEERYSAIRRTGPESNGNSACLVWWIFSSRCSGHRRPLKTWALALPSAR
jgi:hypothetical protein